MCTCVGTGGGEGQVKGGGSRVHLGKLKEVKSKMMTGGATMHLVLEIKFIL